MSKVITEKVETSAGRRSDCLHLIETIDSAGRASVDFVLPSGYFKYELVFDNVVPVTDAVECWFRTSTDGGSTFDSGASNYWWTQHYQYSTSDLSVGSTGDTQIEIAYNIGNSTNESITGGITVYNPSAAQYTRVDWMSQGIRGDAVPTLFSGAGARLSAADVNAIQVLFSSGNFSSGIFKLYGWVA